MSNERSCAHCGVALEPDAPEGSICVDCAQAAASAASEDFAPTVAADGATPAPSTGSASIRANVQPLFERIGDFEVLDKLGQGGMGAVYRARQVSLDRLVALKILPSQFQEDESFVGRFRREATVAASLNHPNLVRVYSSGEADGVHYIAMELVEGENLRQFLRRAGPMAPLDALRTALQVARGLQCGWQKAQLIHRDIKPSNIYLSQSGDVKVGDLGLAKSLSGNTTGITHTGTALGTPHYVSPEQARGDKAVDCRADIYSLGCTLYEMLTGSTPYRGSDPVSVMHSHLHSPPPAILKVLPQCPVPIARLVSKMLQKKPHERHQGYDELSAAMEAAIDQLENPNTGPSAVVQAWKEIGRAEQSFLPARGPASKPPVSMPAPKARDTSVGAAPTSTRKPALLWAGLAAVAAVLALAYFVTKNGQTQPSPKRTNTAALAQPAPAPNPSTALPANIASRAIKLWDAPEKLPKDGNIRWEDGAMRLEKANVKGPQVDYNTILRASVRGDANAAVMALRCGGNTQARLSINLPKLSISRGLNQPDGTLGQWELPRAFKPTDWLRLELRAIGNYLTVIADGQILGVVRTTALPDPGTPMLSATNALFRDVEYIVVDDLHGADLRKLVGAEVPLLSSPPDAAPPSVGGTSKATDVVSTAKWQDALDPNFPQNFDSAGWHAPGSIRMRADSMANLGVRVRYRGNRTTETNFPQINLRNKQRVHPNLQIDPDGKRVKIRTTDQGYPTLAVAPLTSPLTAGMEYAVEFYAIGSTLIGRVNGDTVTAQSPLPPEAGGFNIDPHDYFRDAQVINLDGLPEAESLKLAGLSPSAETKAAPAAEPWQDLLREPEQSLALRTGATVDAAGMHLPIGGEARIRSTEQKPHHDGALRVRAVFGSMPVTLQVRGTRGAGSYQFNVDKKAVLKLFKGAGGLQELRVLSLREPLKPGDEYELELRVVGTTLSASFNGERLEPITDTTLTEGGFGIGAFFGSGAPILIKSFQFLDLDSPLTGNADAPTPATATKPAAAPADFRSLFDGRTFAGWKKLDGSDVPSDWSIADGAMVGGRRSCIRSQEQFSNFELTLEWRADEKGNGGIYYHVPPGVQGENPTAYPEMQLAGPKGDGRWPAGTLFGVVPTTGDVPIGAGEWNRARLVVVRGEAQHWINDQLVCSYNFSGQSWHALAAASTLQAAKTFSGLPWRGSIVLQSAQSEIAYRNIRIRELDPQTVLASIPTASPSAPSTAATKEQPFVNSLGMKFVPVPITGGPTNGRRVLFSIWETRRQDYRAFVSETNRQWAEPKPLFQQGATHPAVMVGWEDATAFCAWLTKREREAKKIGARESYRLPTDHEWSCAAGLGEQEDPAQAPEAKSAKTNEPSAMVGAWPPPAPTGNYGGEEIQPVLTAGVATGEFPATAKPLSEYRDQFVNTAPVGSFPASRLGLYDLDGNVREYCADAPDPSKEQRILRGGSWLSNFRAALLPARRNFTTRRSPTGIDGFRVVLTEE